MLVLEHLAEFQRTERLAMDGRNSRKMWKVGLAVQKPLSDDGSRKTVVILPRYIHKEKLTEAVGHATAPPSPHRAMCHLQVDWRRYPKARSLALIFDRRSTEHVMFDPRLRHIYSQ